VRSWPQQSDVRNMHGDTHSLKGNPLAKLNRHGELVPILLGKLLQDVVGIITSKS
jgi:hypothetical protein